MTACKAMAASVIPRRTAVECVSARVIIPLDHTPAKAPKGAFAFMPPGWSLSEGGARGIGANQCQKVLA
jgi:hypothetical protein